MEDNHLFNHIKKLTEDEEGLWGKPDLSDTETEKLHKIKQELDQCWDLLRRRRALRNSGGDPEKAEARDIDSVENDEQ